MKGHDSHNPQENKKEIYENVSSFLYHSISDMQSTIRSIDTKLGFILILNIIPITNIDKIYSCISQVMNTADLCALKILTILIMILCAIHWLLACICTYRGITSIDNPKTHVSRAHGHAEGSYYTGGLFSLNFVDAFFNKSSITSKKTFSEYRKDIPESNDQTLNELAFDKMKLVYIRDMKLNRQKWAFRLTAYWVMLGFITYVMAKNV